MFSTAKLGVCLAARACGSRSVIGRVQAKVVEVAGHAALLHIGVELHAERQLEGLRDGAEGAGQLGEGSAVVGGLHGVDGGVELRSIVSDFAQRMDARAELRALCARSPVRKPESADFAICLA